MSSSEIKEIAKNVKKNVNLAKHNTELNFLEEFILKQCDTKIYIHNFLCKILDIKNEEFTIQKYCSLFWSNFFKIIKELNTIPDKNTIIIQSKVKTRKTTIMKKKSNTTMKDMTKQLIKNLNL
jgi:hypothetical protein